MRDGIKRDHTITVRLSDAEHAALESLIIRLNLDKSGAVRKALLMSTPKPLSPTGCFTAVHTDLVLPVRLIGEADHGR